MLHTFLTQLGLNGVRLVVNSLGEGDERHKYTASLRQYFQGHQENLCADCQRRLDKNVLQNLDCKVPSCGELADAAPSAIESLASESRAHFEAVQNGLTSSASRTKSPTDSFAVWTTTPEPSSRRWLKPDWGRKIR